MTTANPHLHAVIMAGGSGTRFWPVSRKNLPKQFLPLGGDKTLLRETYERMAPLIEPEHLWVVTGASHAERVLDELPEIPRENVLGEPVGRNTAPCIGIAARQIFNRDPDGILLVTPSDHVVRPPEPFRKTVLEAVRFIESTKGSREAWTVTFGIVPRYPATGFGYIERGAELQQAGGQAFVVERFKEKPPVEVAREYLESGRFFWNSGIFLWSAEGILGLMEQHLPRLAAGINALDREASGPGGLDAAMKASFGSLPAISVDHGILEHAPNIAVVAADFDWDDVGSWQAMARYGRRDEEGNTIFGDHVGIDTKDCIVVGKKRLIGTIGLQNLVVVETDDAILVCPRDQTERVKEIVGCLQTEGREDLL
jgi:mannose-1-phosphate guanylyltransferase